MRCEYLLLNEPAAERYLDSIWGEGSEVVCPGPGPHNPQSGAFIIELLGTGVI